MKYVISSLLMIFSISVLGTILVKIVSLNQNCIGYLKRTADASNIEVAKQELEKAINYLEANNLTSGYTSIIWETPDEDIEFWYNNLKTTQKELGEVTEKTSSVEQTNLLMKLRETLIDTKERGDTLTVPEGLAKYPNNTLYAVLTVLSIFSFFASIIVFFSSKNSSIKEVLLGIFDLID